MLLKASIKVTRRSIVIIYPKFLVTFQFFVIEERRILFQIFVLNNTNSKNNSSHPTKQRTNPIKHKSNVNEPVTK